MLLSPAVCTQCLCGRAARTPHRSRPFPLLLDTSCSECSRLTDIIGCSWRRLFLTQMRPPGSPGLARFVGHLVPSVHCMPHPSQRLTGEMNELIRFASAHHVRPDYLLTRWIRQTVSGSWPFVRSPLQFWAVPWLCLWGYSELLPTIHYKCHSSQHLAVDSGALMMQFFLSSFSEQKVWLF